MSIIKPGNQDSETETLFHNFHYRQEITTPNTSYLILIQSFLMFQYFSILICNSFYIIIIFFFHNFILFQLQYSYFLFPQNIKFVAHQFNDNSMFKAKKHLKYPGNKIHIHRMSIIKLRNQDCEIESLFNNFHYRQKITTRNRFYFDTILFNISIIQH